MSAKAGSTIVRQARELAGGAAGQALVAVDAATRPRTVLFGRVRDGVPAVSVNHDDATRTKASIGDGWYAVWWPVANEAIAVAAVDRRNTVIDSYPP